MRKCRASGSCDTCDSPLAFSYMDGSIGYWNPKERSKVNFRLYLDAKRTTEPTLGTSSATRTPGWGYILPHNMQHN